MKNLGRFASTVHILGLALVFAVKAHGQTSAELSCKAQAKEVAVQTYQSCVTESRQTQIDTLRKEYQEKLSELKDHYNKELKKAAGKESQETEVSAPTAAPQAASDESSVKLKPIKKAAVAKSVKAQKPVKGLARTLPKKTTVTSALPVQAINDDVKVVPMASTSIENDAAQADMESSGQMQESLNN